LVLALGMSGVVQAQLRSFADPVEREPDISPPGFVDDGIYHGSAGFGFGKKIAGTWIGSLEIPGVLPPAPLIQTYNVDGTAQTSSNNVLSSVHHMEWERAGEREIKWRILHFSFDADGNIATISRTSGVHEYDPDFEEFAGEFVVEVCLPDPETGFDALLADPNDPAACFIPPIPPGFIQAKRLHVDIP
jgi:hypothetical protein